MCVARVVFPLSGAKRIAGGGANSFRRRRLAVLLVGSHSQRPCNFSREGNAHLWETMQVLGRSVSLLGEAGFIYRGDFVSLNYFSSGDYYFPEHCHHQASILFFSQIAKD